MPIPLVNTISLNVLKHIKSVSRGDKYALLDLVPYFKAMLFSPAFVDVRFYKSAICMSQCSTTTFI